MESEDQDAFLDLLSSHGGDSDYYTVDSFNNFSKKFNNSKLSVITFNVRSFHKHCDEFIGFLNCINLKFDVIILTETWLSDLNKDIANIDGYNVVHSIRTKKQGGGVSLFIRDSLNFEVNNNLIINNDIFECVGVTLNLLDVKISILGVYRPPGGNLNSFSNSFFNLINENNLTFNKTIISGDLNFCLLKHDHCQATNDLIIDFYSNSFYPTIHIPTRSNENSRSLIDHFWLNLLINSTSGVLLTDITDHYPIFSIIDLPIKTDQQKISIKFRDFSLKNKNKFLEALNIIHWQNLLHDNDINTCTNLFLEKLFSLFNSSFPLMHKEISIKRLNNPWLTSALLKSVKYKNHLYKLFKLNRISKLYYTRYRNRLTSTLRAAKKQYFECTFAKHKLDIRKTWLCIKDTIGKKHKKVSPISLNDSNGTPISNNLVPDSFNNYFTSIAPNLISGLSAPLNDFKSYMNTPNLNSIFLQPSTPNEVINVIYSLKNTKSPTNEIPSFIYKSFSTSLADPISVLFNKMIDIGVFPDTLKISRVTPIYKKDDPACMGNYRPISNLSNLNKIFEKLIYKRLFSFLDTFDLLNESQFGFRKGLSTEDAINFLTTNVYNSLNNNQFVGAAFLDLSKAFDTISHDILISKLQYYGIRGKCLDLISSYLSNRSQYVFVNGIKSRLKPISFGVPQGSILGPLLFVLYINDLPSIFKYSKCLLYADDTTLFYNHTNLKILCNRISSDMYIIYNWFTANKLIVNESKTRFVIFTNKCVPSDTSITINNTIILATSNHDFLGVVLDKTLSFSQHINLVSSKISKTIGILFKIKDFVPKNILRIIYTSLIQSYLSYGISVWGAANPTNLHPLIILQKRAIRLISNSNYLDHTNPIFHNFNILKLNDLYKIRCLKYIYSTIFLNKHKFILDFITAQQINHNYHTRNTDLRLPTVRLFKFKQSLVYKSILYWNEIKNFVPLDKGINKFMKTVKKKLILGYSVYN